MDHAQRAARRRDLARRFNQGESIASLAKSGIGSDTIMQYMRKDCPEEWERRKQLRLAAIRREKVRKMVATMTRREIAAKLGCRLSTVLKDCEALGITVPRARKSLSQQFTTLRIAGEILNGLSDKEIAKATKNTVSRVRRIRIWMGLLDMVGCKNKKDTL